MPDQSITEALERLCADNGMTFGDAVAFFAARQNEQARRYASYARENLQDDGSVEFDEPCMVSAGTDRGAYVMAWVWVDQGDVGLTDLEQAEAAA